MRVSVELPDPPRLEPLLESLSQQYAGVMRQLMQLQQESQREDRYAPILSAMRAQQDGLVMAFERLMGLMQQGRSEDHQRMGQMMREEVAAPQQQASDALISAIRGVKKTLSGLPDDLGSVMNKSMRHTQQKLMKHDPEPKPAPDSSRQVVEKLDAMESALLLGLKKSRNRTFGSNY